MSGITIWVTIVLSLMGLGVAFFYMKKVVSIPLDLGLDEAQGEKLTFIHGAIAEGAMAFLKQEYTVLTIFMVVFAAIIAILINDTHTPDIHEGIGQIGLGNAHGRNVALDNLAEDAVVHILSSISMGITLQLCCGASVSERRQYQRLVRLKYLSNICTTFEFLDHRDQFLAELQ